MWLSMRLVVQKAGLLTTVQDLGRFGYQQFGVVTGGVMDELAMRLANILIGNDEQAAGLEMTMVGAELLLEQSQSHDRWHSQGQKGSFFLIAVCGADMEAEVDGIPVPLWRPVWVKTGSILKMKYARIGCRAYVAVAGGIDVPLVLGSRSTYPQAGIGGLNGRQLIEGDVLETGALSKAQQDLKLPFKYSDLYDNDTRVISADWFASTTILSNFIEEPVVRFVRGPEAGWLHAESWKLFTAQWYKVLPQSDRMGIRLESEEPISMDGSGEMVSGAALPGIIQLPPSGQPIVLMADSQTTGGYPRIGVVISVDLPLLAQVKPGDSIRLVEVSIDEAQAYDLLRAYDLQVVRSAVRQKLERGADR